MRYNTVLSIWGKERLSYKPGVKKRLFYPPGEPTSQFTRLYIFISVALFRVAPPFCLIIPFRLV